MKKNFLFRAAGIFMAALTVISAVAACPVSAADDTDPISPVVTRLYGQTRYDTAFDISQKVEEICGGYSEIVIASGENYPDALSAVSFAAKHNAPLFLTPSAELPIAVRNKFSSQKVDTAYIIGGTYAVSPSAEYYLKYCANNIVRIAGENRYDTAVAVANAFDFKGSDLYIASGEGYADALSISAAAGANGVPVLFVPRDGTIPDGMANFIRSHNIKRITVAGGSAAISDSLDSKLKNTFGISEVNRVYGQTRYDTSAEILRYFTEQVHTFDKETGVALASGEKFPDALSGGVCAALSGYPLLLVSENDRSCNNVISEAADWFRPQKAYVFGGEYAVSEPVIKQVLKVFSNTITAKNAVTANVSVWTYTDHSYISKDAAMISAGKTYEYTEKVTAPIYSYSSNGKSHVGYNVTWYKININGQTGWACGDWVTEGTATSVYKPQPMPFVDRGDGTWVSPTSIEYVKNELILWGRSKGWVYMYELDKSNTGWSTAFGGSALSFKSCNAFIEYLKGDFEYCMMRKNMDSYGISIESESNGNYFIMPLI